MNYPLFVMFVLIWYKNKIVLPIPRGACLDGLWVWDEEIDQDMEGPVMVWVIDSYPFHCLGTTRFGFGLKMGVHKFNSK